MGNPKRKKKKRGRRGEMERKRAKKKGTRLGLSNRGERECVWVRCHSE